MFSMIDRWIDRRVDRTFLKFRKLGRRAESVYGTTYKSWLYYISRRSKDPYIKLNIGVMLCCYVLVYRTFRRTYRDSKYSAQGLKHKDVLRSLEYYNEYGSTMPPLRDQRILDMTRSEAKDHFDFTSLRFH
mmetsp:Transcript_28639/g.50925  ORF Transcript_28639/g.50925 Transcript_28639/m.50925 type:complete len:131 (+) Transcript_28639:673-1065(+)